MEINSIKVNKQTFNKAYVTFKDPNFAKRWLDVLIRRNVNHTSYVYKKGNDTYYAFKMFRIKKIIFELYNDLEGVIG